MSEVQSKTCTKCGEHKPITEFFFTYTRPGVKLYRAECKACKVKMDLQSRQKSLVDKSWIERNQENGYHLWERQPGESEQAWKAWLVYRAMIIDPTIVVTNRLVAEKLDCGVGVISHFSKKWSWPERVVAYTNYIDRQRVAEEDKARKEMLERHTNMAKKIQEKALKRLEKLNPDELSPRELAQWADFATKLERLSRGESTENVKQTLTAEVTSNHPQLSQAKEDEKPEQKMASILHVLKSAGALQKAE